MTRRQEKKRARAVFTGAAPPPPPPATAANTPAAPAARRLWRARQPHSPRTCQVLLCPLLKAHKPSAEGGTRARPQHVQPWVPHHWQLANGVDIELDPHAHRRPKHGNAGRHDCCRCSKRSWTVVEAEKVLIWLLARLGGLRTSVYTAGLTVD